MRTVGGCRGAQRITFSPAKVGFRKVIRTRSRDQISTLSPMRSSSNDVKLGHADDSHANTRSGCETLATTNKIVIAGEGRPEPYMRKYGKHTVVNREITEIARGVVRDIGYDQDGFSFHGADVEVPLHGQSPDIAMGVDAKKKGGNLGEQEGAGDQGPDVRLRLPRQRGGTRRAPSCRRRSISHKILGGAEQGARRSASCPTCSPTPRARSPCAMSTARRSAPPKRRLTQHQRERIPKGRKYNSGLIKR